MTAHRQTLTSRHTVPSASRRPCGVAQKLLEELEELLEMFLEALDDALEDVKEDENADLALRDLRRGREVVHEWK